MTHASLPRRSEAGSALVVALGVLLTVMIFSATVFQATSILASRTNVQTDGQRAFGAANAGADAAVHRIAVVNPAATSCDTGVTSTVSGSWCTTSNSETVAGGAAFTYSVSTSPIGTGCVGTTPPGATSDRCVVATGTANGTRRRVEVRIAGQGGTDTSLFYQGTAIGLSSVKLESSVTVSSDLHTNGTLEVSHNSTISGPITIGPHAKTPKGITSSSWTRTTSDFTAPMPDFTGTDQPYNAGNNPLGNFDSTIPSTNWDGSSTLRDLHVRGNKSLTLPPGTYNFCKIKIDGRGIINTAGTSANPVKIYLDSPFRPGSGCAKDGGQIQAGPDGAFVNPSLDPTALQIYSWGSTTKKQRKPLQIPLGKKGTLAAAIYAPGSEIRFYDDKATLIGGIIGNKIIFKKGMHFISDSRVTNYTATTLSQSFRVAWKQCDSTIVNPATPTQGC